MTIQTERDIVDALIAWHRDPRGNHRLPTLEECLKVRGRLTSEQAALHKIAGICNVQLFKGGSDVKTL